MKVDIFNTENKYKIIYADPAWLYRDKAVAGGRGAGCHYTVTSLEDIKALPVEKLADDDSVLFMWVTMPFLEEAFDVMRSWGFEYKTCAFTWIKQNKKADTLFWGMGNWTTFGELWLDGDYVGECYKAQAKVEFTKEEIKQCGTFFTDNKVVGCKGTGSLTMHKVNSRMAIKVANMVRNKQDVRFTLISKLADPDAYGAERVSITGVQMDDLTLFDWEAQKPLETEAPFTFTGYEYLDQITPQ